MHFARTLSGKQRAVTAAEGQAAQDVLPWDTELWLLFWDSLQRALYF